MAERAEVLLDRSGWLPEPLRSPNRSVVLMSQASEAPELASIEPAGEASAATGCEPAIGETEGLAENEPAVTEPRIIAAE